jgi:hypothetical protein
MVTNHPGRSAATGRLTTRLPTSEAFCEETAPIQGEPGGEESRRLTGMISNATGGAPVAFVELTRLNLVHNVL